MPISINLLFPKIVSRFLPKAPASQLRSALINWIREANQETPHSFPFYIRNDGNVISKVLGNTLTLNPPSKPGLYEVRFSEYQGYRIAHIFDQEGKLQNNYEIKFKANSFVVKGLDWWGFSKSDALTHGQAIHQWFTENGDLPVKRPLMISSNGSAVICFSGNTLHFNSLGRQKREAIAIFVEFESEKRIEFYEADQKTLIKTFNIKKDSNDHWQAIPLEQSLRQLSNAHGRSIVDWLSDNAECPSERPLKISKSGIGALMAIDNKQIRFCGLGPTKRNALIRFFLIEGKKIASVFEEDGRTHIKSYQFGMDSKGYWLALPFKKTLLQKSRDSKNRIRNILLAETKSTPSGLTISLQVHSDGICDLGSIGPGKLLLHGLGKTEREVIVKINKYDGETHAEVYESDEKTHIRTYKIAVNPSGHWQAMPLELTFREYTYARGRLVIAWLVDSAVSPTEQPFMIHPSGFIRLVKIDREQILLTGLGPRKRKALVRFVEIEDEKRVDVYEEDGKTHIKTFIIKKNAAGNWMALPLEMTPLQISKNRNKTIKQWLLGNGNTPPERKAKIHNGETTLLQINKRRVYLRNLGSKECLVILRFVSSEDEKKVEVYEISGKLISTYLLAKGNQIYYDPPTIKDEYYLKKYAELEKLIEEGKYKELLKQLPEDLRIDFLLMLFSRKYGEDVISEYATRLDKEEQLLESNINIESVVKPTIVPSPSDPDVSDLKAKTRQDEQNEPKRPTKVISGIDGKHPLSSGKNDLEKLENALSIGAFNGVKYEAMLSIIQARYLHELLVEFKFDIPSALAYARKKLSELIDNNTLLFWTLDWTVKHLERRFSFSGLAEGISLKPHQQLGIRFLLDHPQALLGDEMGSGKTLQALLAAVNSESRKVLIICRSNGRNVWRDEIESKIDSAEDKSHLVIRSPRDLKKTENARFIIVNYEFARGHVAELQALAPDMIILDEAHALCHEDSQQSSKIRSIKAERKIAVSGTPLLNESKELWPILNFILPEEFPSAEAFEKNYTLNLYQRALLNNRLREIMLRRKMGEYSLALPPLIEEAITVPMTDKQAEVYRQITEDPVRWAFDHKVKFTRLKLIGWLIQAADDIGMMLSGSVWKTEEGGKYLKTKQLISDSPEKKRIIFARNRAVMKHLNSILPESAVISMGTPQDRREEIIEEYKSGSLKTIIMSYQLGGESYNLPETDEIILFDQAWNTPQKQQAIYRAYRLNRSLDRPLKVVSLLSEGTIDEDIVTLQADKWREFREVVEGAKDKRKLNEEKMERLLQMSQRRRLSQMLRDEYLEEIPEKLRSIEFMRAIGRGDFEAVAKYYREHLFELKAFWVAVARIGMMLERGIPLWKDELTLGAGPSTLYEAWQKLKSENVIQSAPTVVDVDQSPEMNRVAANPNKHLLSMTRLSGVEGEYDVIGAEFSFYYVDPLDRADVIRQAWYKLRENGYLVLSGPNMIFEKEALEAIEKLGFKVLTVPGEQVGASNLLFEVARASGKTQDEAADLVKNTGILIAQKTADEPTEEEVYIPINKAKSNGKNKPVTHDPGLDSMKLFGTLSDKKMSEREKPALEFEELESLPAPELVETRLLDERGRVVTIWLPSNDPRVRISKKQ